MAKADAQNFLTTPSEGDPQKVDVADVNKAIGQVYDDLSGSKDYPILVWHPTGGAADPNAGAYEAVAAGTALEVLFGGVLQGQIGTLAIALASLLDQINQNPAAKTMIAGELNKITTP